MSASGSNADNTSPFERGDLFSDAAPAADAPAESSPFYKTEQFVYTLKWTHIDLFGMNIIFIFMGIIAIFLNVRTRWKTLLVVLPFAGVLIDIVAMWLKGYVFPAFFWLHIPGGGLFGISLFYVSLRAFQEMWWMRKNTQVLKKCTYLNAQKFRTCSERKERIARITISLGPASGPFRQLNFH